MNRYNTGVTVELRDLVENGVDIWAFDYPSYYQGQAKKDFEQKVIDHYYLRQIGQETTGRFLHYFRSRIREIMPYYVQLYKTEEIMSGLEDPFESYNLTEEYTEETSGSGKITNSSSSESSSESTGEQNRNTNRSTETDTTRNDNSTERFSDTPQGNVVNLDTHLTNAKKISADSTEDRSEDSSEDSTETSSGSASSSSSGSGEQNSEDAGNKHYTLTRRGNIGVQTLGYEINQFRKAILNIDLMIINELKDLFLQVY